MDTLDEGVSFLCVQVFRWSKQNSFEIILGFFLQIGYRGL